MEEDKLNEISELLKEQNNLQREQINLLKQIYSFWTKIVSDEYFNEVVAKNQGELPR